MFSVARGGDCQVKGGGGKNENSENCVLRPPVPAYCHYSSAHSSISNIKNSLSLHVENTYVTVAIQIGILSSAAIRAVDSDPYSFWEILKNKIKNARKLDQLQDFFEQILYKNCSMLFMS